MDHLVSPSLLAADFGNLQKEVSMVNNSQADWIHLDIMDGLFVPNISFGFPVIDPDRYLSRFRDAGASILTVQYEACTHLNRTVSEIRNLGMKAGVALNPHTPVAMLKNILPYIDMVLIMTVNPGFGGQSFIMESYNKIAELHGIIGTLDLNVMIEVDGGIDTRNAARLVNAGVNVLVAGNSVFSSPDPSDTIRRLKNLA
jgi:ribulose-phosphate 3-epimerase